MTGRFAKVSKNSENVCNFAWHAKKKNPNLISKKPRNFVPVRHRRISPPVRTGVRRTSIGGRPIVRRHPINHGSLTQCSFIFTRSFSVSPEACFARPSARSEARVLYTTRTLRDSHAALGWSLARRSTRVRRTVSAHSVRRRGECGTLHTTGESLSPLSAVSGWWWANGWN